MQTIDYRGMINIHGDLYQFNESRDKLLSASDSKGISLSRLDDGGDCYQGRYERDRKTFRPDDPDLTEIDKYWWPFLSIPKILIEQPDLSPEEIAKYNQQSLLYNHGYCIVDEDLSLRMNGQVPTIQFDGITYIIDALNREIKQQVNPENKFKFPKGQVYPIILYYNTLLKEPVNIDPRLENFPEHTIGLRFPDLFSMDPLAYHRRHGHDYRTVAFYPWRATETDIKVVSLPNVLVLEQVRDNQIAKQIMQQLEKNAQKNNRRKRHSRLQ